MKRFFHNLGHTVYSIYICIRFPFLYPRNVWTGEHWNSWKLRDHMCNIFKENTTCNHENGFSIVWNSRWNRFRWNFCGFLEGFLGIFHCIPTYNLLDWMPDGWRKAFGIRLCEDIKKELLKTGGRKLLRSYRVYDIKEKWGCLRWDDAGGTAGLYKIIAMYEELSQHYCIVCGELATCIAPMEYWRSPYCDKHFPKNCKCKLEYGTDLMPWFGHRGNIHFRDEEEWKNAVRVAKEYNEGAE